MRGLFGGSAGASADDLKAKLAKIREETYEQAVEHQRNLSTIEAQGKAQLAWVDKNSEKIQNRYLELVTAYENDDKRAVERFAYLDDETSAFVFSMPVIDENGKQNTFGDWAARLFDDETLTSKIEKTISEGLTPDFSDVKGSEPSLRKPTYEDIEKGFMSGVTGSYISALNDAISEAELAQLQASSSHDLEVISARETAASALKYAFDKQSEDMITVAVVLRLESFLDADSDTLRTIYQSNLPYAIENYGYDETMAWLDAENPEGDSPIERILQKSKYKLDDAKHPIHTILKSLPNDIAVSAKLLELSEKAPYPLMAKELKELAIEKAGDFVPVGNNALFRPDVCGFVTFDGEDGIKAAPLGHGIDFDVAEGVGTPLIEVLAQRDGFIRENDSEVTILSHVTKTNIATVSGETKLVTHLDGRTWSESMEEDKASTSIEKRKDDPRFVQLQDKTLIDKTAVTHAWVEKDAESGEYEVHYVIGEKSHSIVGIETEAKAEEFMVSFSEADSALRFTDTETVLGSAIGNLWIEDEGTADKISFVVNGEGTSYYVDMPNAKAKQILAQIAEEHNHVMLNDNESMNPDRASVIYYDPEEKALAYVIDASVCITPMTKEKAFRVMKHIEENYEGFSRHQKEGLINPDKLGRVQYDPEKKYLKYLLGTKQWGSTVTMTAAKAIAARLEQSPHFQKLDENTFINLNTTSNVEYDAETGKLGYTVNGIKDDEKYYPSVSVADAKAVLEQIEAYGIALAKERLEASYDGIELEEYSLPEEPTYEEPVEEIEVPGASNDDEPETPEQQRNDFGSWDI